MQSVACRFSLLFRMQHQLSSPTCGWTILCQMAVAPQWGNEFHQVKETESDHSHQIPQQSSKRRKQLEDIWPILQIMPTIWFTTQIELHVMR